jgi:GxxExxY protein
MNKFNTMGKREDEGHFLYEELTAQIINACFEVINELGVGFLEAVYQNAVLIALRQKGLKAVDQFPLSVIFRGEIVGMYYADLFVEDKVILELKSVSALAPEHQAQVINYLKGTGIEVGLLVNFGRPKLEIKRLHKSKSPTELHA